MSPERDATSDDPAGDLPGSDGPTSPEADSADQTVDDKGLELRPFRAIGHYEWPEMPAQHRLQSLWKRLRKEFGNADDAPLLTSDDLDQLEDSRLDLRMPWPPCAAMLDELQLTLDEQSNDTLTAIGSSCRVVILPPCDDADRRWAGVMKTWADREGHTVLAPPDRLGLLDSADLELPSLAGEGVLVIPDLADWFLRHTRGLFLLCRLIDTLHTLERPTVVGCNSWAWAFLTKAININLRLPKPLLAQPYDADRLRIWFASPEGAQVSNRFVFRRSDTGAAIMATGKEGKASDDYLQSLAATSLGIPWIAWHTFRHVQRTLPDNASGEDIEDMRESEDENTAWLATFPEFTLPTGHESAARLVLHSLLIHGGLSEAALVATLPLAGCRDLLGALTRTGHLIELSGVYKCAPEAYPAIRQSLNEGSFPMDKL